jgi:putative transposase
MQKERAYKYRFYPTDEQAKNLAQTFGCARFVYNHGLELRTKAWQRDQVSMSYEDTCAELTEFKKRPEVAFLSDVSAAVLQQSLRNLNRAFENFFDKRAKYPDFKKKFGKQSVRYGTNAFTLKDGKLKLAKQAEPLNIVWSRPLPDDTRLISCTVSKDKAERYFISILVKTDIQPLPEVDRQVGIDVGLTTLATLSNGEKLENPRHMKRKSRRLKVRQRRLSRKVKGSNNRNKARFAVAKMHAKISDARKDNLHKFTSKTINENQVIVVEGLAIANMVKNHCLAGAINDAAWGEIFRQLEYKSDWAGRTYLELDRWFPGSKLCSACGHLLSHLNLSIREWDCPKCNTHHDRDDNAAKNHLAAGLYLLKTTRSDAGKVTPTRYERRRSG